MRVLSIAIFGIGLIAATPTFAQTNLGMALMSAVVNTNGSLIRGSGGTTNSSKTAGGTYVVQFNRNVSACTYVAVLGDPATALPPVGYAVVSTWGTNPNGVFVETLNTSGNLTDASFHLFVFCSQ